MPPSKPKNLVSQIDQCMLRDRHRFRQRLRDLKKKPDGAQKLRADVDRSIDLRRQRAAALPQPSFPENLPVTQKLDDIALAVREHQVVIVCGETGSGKSTQLPKLCLALGRGVDGSIAHTQPRRLAARAISSRLAQELGVSVGAGVGFKVRFSENTGPLDHIKVLTDGMLLAECQSDRFLNEYDTIIIDEAHERSLNIDFLLGILKQLLPKRPELKVIITSATIDPERFSHHFDDAPIINVSGRTYPVEVRYRPLRATAQSQQVERNRKPEPKNFPAAILEAIKELGRDGNGDILVFLSGEREIRETHHFLHKAIGSGTEILPLYARLASGDQQKIFRSHRGRRVVLATNVAETSLTVPGIRYVIDTGLARISRYSHTRKVQRLPIENISQASANQRQGRCGRVADGICIRLYSEEDFLARAEFTDPEIRRSSLAAVILRMQFIRLGRIEQFPFLDAPETRMVRDGYQLLQELEAVDRHNHITRLGRELARLPVDPRIARILLAAVKEDCLSDMLVIAAALEVQDPREFPQERLEAARQAHARYRDEKSDFVAWLNLWRLFHEETADLSQRQRRDYCKKNFLSFNRVREWREVYRQLRQLMTELGYRARPPQGNKHFQAIHKALLTGFLGNVANKSEKAEYLATRGKKLWIFPGSGLAKKPPAWLMAAELVDTSRLYARTCAAIEPEWIEQVAAPLVTRQYTEPHWEKRAGRVIALEQVSLYGLVLVSQRKKHYGPINPKLSREILIREGLVTGEIRGRLPFLTHNMQVLGKIESLEERARKRDIRADDEAIFAFYDERIPAGITTARSLESWLKKAKIKDDGPDLRMKPEDFMQRKAAEITAADYPETITVKNITCPLAYHFEPGADDDGVTATLPLVALNQLENDDFSQLIPALLPERMVALIRSLPKNIRRNFAPAPEFAKSCLDAVASSDEPLTTVMGRELLRMTGVHIPPEAWDESRLPDHLRMRYRIIDGNGITIASGRDLAELKKPLSKQAQQTFGREKTVSPKNRIEREHVLRWDFGKLPRQTEVSAHGVSFIGYPALVDTDGDCAIEIFDTEEKARLKHHAGLARLFVLQLEKRLNLIRKNLPDIRQICLTWAATGACEALKDDIIQAVIERAFLANGDDIFDQKAFEQRLQSGSQHLGEYASDICRALKPVLADFNELIAEINQSTLPASDDIKTHLYDLIYPGFVAQTPWRWLKQFPRYLRGARLRFERLQHAAAKDAERAALLAPWLERYEKLLKEGVATPQSEIRWMLEEYRISLFAQEVKTSMPISQKRLEQAFTAYAR
ncbi:MAG: ATP-dependent RNA helicase HrpA [Gammaproteobacteria bacterium]|nr:MAG: ATP-dependent RNA helicase HrpA [Gammaproteobacteria bacterium]